MKASRFVKAFEKDVDYWERSLSQIMETIELLLVVQRQWMYLEVILNHYFSIICFIYMEIGCNEYTDWQAVLPLYVVYKWTDLIPLMLLKKKAGQRILGTIRNLYLSQLLEIVVKCGNDRYE